ncbi:phage protein, HK97 gp10 family [Anaerolinea thermolimosa]|uniref:HK97-gp10 family putative phage morphogenesis protein n=1 Tax=Anaerolinea thermolimosa TaxID=229919 RepID=UPI000784FC40|nr:HK97-gp10 family putative phage morphogenesis protein [Anaerolinea thermolimosa]GAP07124.1 phage protein, HK97 gp10 family [Anaerolinea thermolimosa]
MEIEGLAELLKQIEGLGKIPSSDALLKGAMVLQGLSMQNAPVKTGFLRQSHESTKTESGAQMIVHAEYAVYQEWGTSKMPGKGFVRRAIDEGKKAILDEIRNAIQEEIKKL